MRTLLLVFSLLSLAAGCTGNIGDVFEIFPREAFDEGDGGGDQPGQPGQFVPAEVASLGASQGIGGDVRNVALVSLDDRTFAFIAAGVNGVHVIDVTEPDLLNETDLVTTISDAVLTAPAALAGGRVDALTIVDGFLVCLAVGTVGTNGVTVFGIDDLIAAATSRTADLSAAHIPLAAGDAGIPVPGNTAGDGGGVSGISLNFFIADGSPTIKRGIIDPGAGTWSSATAIVTLASVISITDVQINQTFAIYASAETTPPGATERTFGVVTVGNPLTPAPVTPVFSEIDDEFERVIDEFVVGPGNFPLDLALDSLTLYVTGQDALHVFNATNPIGPSLLTTLENTGEDTISVDADGGVVVIGAGSVLQIATNVLGQTRLTGQVTFGGTFTIRGVVLHSTNEGNFALCCAGTQGLRVVQLSEAAQ